MCIAGLLLPTSRRPRADLEPPKGKEFGFGFGLGLGSGWSGPTCKVENDHTSFCADLHIGGATIHIYFEVGPYEVRNGIPRANLRTMHVRASIR